MSNRCVPLIGILVQGLLLGCTGCMVGPNYQPPDETLPDAFSETPSTAPSTQASIAVAGVEATQRWWMSFHDAELNSLIQRAVRGNRDVQLAISRLRQARAQRGVVAAELYPQIDGNAGYLKSYGSKNVVLPLGGSSGAGSAGPTARPAAESNQSDSSGASAGQARGLNSPLGAAGFPGQYTDIYQAGFDATWEIDIFGGTRRAVEAASADIAAAGDDLQAVRVSLLAEVAVNYIELRAAQRRLQIAQDNLKTQQDSLRISQDRFKTGFVTELDVSRESAQVASTAATIPALQSLVRESMHRLAFLIGENAGALEAELAAPAPLPSVPPEIPVGMPSDLLRRRPDVRRAERQLAAATAQIGVATADLFPRFNLTGAAGLDSSDFKHLADWQSHYYSVGPGITWPILDWGRIRNNIRVRNQLQQQALITYENTIAQALNDVEDALVQYQNEQTRRNSLADSVQSNLRSVNLASQQYEKGVVDELAVLDAQRSLLAAQDALAQSDQAIRTSLVSLYKSLGGGWEP